MFRILCEQFSSNNKTPDEELRILHKNLKINNTNENQIEICVSKQNICFNIQDYSINSFLINLSFEKKNIMIKNHSQKLFCRDKIYEEYYNDFIQLLIKISCSHTVEILQSLHNDFKLTKAFFSDESIRKDFFDNRLKFYTMAESKYFVENLEKFTSKEDIAAVVKKFHDENPDLRMRLVQLAPWGNKHIAALRALAVKSADKRGIRRIKSC